MGGRGLLLPVVLAIGCGPDAHALPPGLPAAGTGEIHVVDYLPPGHVTDGSVDYTRYVQAALNAASGATLVLPNHPLLVSRQGSTNWCLLAPSRIAVVGSPGSVLRELGGSVQILRTEDADGARFTGFTLEGAGFDGKNLAHGLLQITRGRDVVVREVTVRDSDADGIAVANVENVQVVGCRLSNVSKSSIYLSDCTNGLVRGNVVTDFGGHVWGGAWTVGTGIQLSSSADVTCSDNIVTGGIGVGILCNALNNGNKPYGNVLAGNRITSIDNPTNLNFSSGIRCNNGNPDKVTNTLVANNSVRGCGAYGIYVDGHGGSTIVGNTLTESERSGIFVGSVQDLQVTGNAILNSDTSGIGQQAGILLFNAAARVTARGNVIRNSPLYLPAKAIEGTLDFSTGGGHDLEPSVRHANGPPSAGSWQRGDLVYAAAPVAGGHLGWVCIASGYPGSWAPFGKIAALE